MNNEYKNNSKLLAYEKVIVTCYLGGDAGGDRGAKALIRGCFDGEEVGGPWVETYKQVMSLVPQLDHPSPLGCQVSAGVQRAQSLVSNLEWTVDTHFSLTQLDGNYLSLV